MHTIQHKFLMGENLDESGLGKHFMSEMLIHCIYVVRKSILIDMSNNSLET